MKEIKLTKNQVALVDDEDYEWLNKYKWHCKNRPPYHNAARTTNNTTILMHREIMRPGPGYQVDHINHQTLDNQKSNLRIVTISQNHQNSKKYKAGNNIHTGVSWDKRECKYKAKIIVNKK